jgi:hypothetical protein
VQVQALDQMARGQSAKKEGQQSSNSNKVSFSKLTTMRAMRSSSYGTLLSAMQNDLKGLYCLPLQLRSRGQQLWAVNVLGQRKEAFWRTIKIKHFLLVWQL